jgi:hypothetical protein
VKKLGFLKGSMKERSLMSSLQLEKEAARDKSVFVLKSSRYQRNSDFVRIKQLELKDAADASYNTQARA